MIQKFVDAFMAKREDLRVEFARAHVGSYKDLVHMVVKTVTDSEEYDSIDPDRIHEIDDGDHQGTLVYVIACEGYQPSTYWYVRVYYGSCSGCDTLQSIHGYTDEPPTPEQVNDYLTLALHIVQGLKQMDGDAA